MNTVLKVVLLGPGPDDREAVVIKHYVDLVLPCYEKLKEKILATFSQLRSAGNNLKLYWLDAEKDRITIFNEEDFRFYLDHTDRGSIYVNIIDGTLTSVGSPTKIAKIQEDTSKTTPTGSEELVLHPNIVCGGCEGPVVGFRYNCSKCIGFDLCMGCEAKMIHRDHAMYRIPVPILALNRLEFNMSKKNRAALLAALSYESGNRCPDYQDNLLGYFREPNHTEQTVRQNVADILKQFNMDPFNVTDTSVLPEKQTSDSDEMITKTMPVPTASEAHQGNTEEAFEPTTELASHALPENLIQVVPVSPIYEID